MLGVAVLHAHDTGKSFLMDVLEYIQVVDLPGGRFLPAGIIPHLEIANLIPCQVNIGNQVPFMNLLVIEVIQDLTGRTVYGLTNVKSLRNLI